ncbi:prepilin-type N-terminal cleavage/methylation domain-containing protein [Patescibacteria group bacterium]|nr:prepilin-type N-terminal cleavage/methylation domain-containing protein [Patescibacteria group bacterium]
MRRSICFAGQRSFTLIELLVVIAVIGVLSGIVLVSLRGTRDKAETARTLLFNNQVQHALGAYAIGIWNFENGTARDVSGNGRDGTVVGATFLAGLPELGDALQFGGDGDRVTVVNHPSLNNLDELTISLWFNAAGAMGGSFLINKDGNNGWYTQDKCIYVGGANKGCFGVITLGEWYHIVFTYNGSSISVYKNSVKMDERAHSGVLPSASNILSFGASPTGSYPFNGMMDEVGIYSRALTTAQVRQLYFAGLPRHLAEVWNPSHGKGILSF